MGISDLGDDAELRFRLITGATLPGSKAQGDAIFNNVAIEVKMASANTINQVRAVKFIPLVIWSKESNDWFVLPAPDIVALVSQKLRGQHTENPFESATLSLSKLRSYRVNENLLVEALHDAITRASEFEDLRLLMSEILKKSKDLALESRAKVHAVIASNHEILA